MNPESVTPEPISSFPDKHLTKERKPKKRNERQRFNSPMLTRRHVTTRVTTPTAQGAKFWRPKCNSWRLAKLEHCVGTWPPLRSGTNTAWHQSPFTLDRGHRLLRTPISPAPGVQMICNSRTKAPDKGNNFEVMLNHTSSEVVIDQITNWHLTLGGASICHHRRQRSRCKACGLLVPPHSCL